MGRERHLSLNDADNFKNVNDTYGHNIGDKVIISIGSSIQEVCARNRCTKIKGPVRRTDGRSRTAMFYN